MLDHSTRSLCSPARDSVDALEADSPSIVSISDIHGHLTDARNALLTLADHPEYSPVVEPDAARRLHWAGNDEYVLIFNGDLIDRGPHSAEVVEMVSRLIEEAPPGHVRLIVGNHEMGVVTPDVYQWEEMGWYSADRTDTERRQFLQAVLDGHVIAAYEGHNVTYAHAGQGEPYDTETLNDHFATAIADLEAVIGTREDADVQQEITDAHPRVFGFDGQTGRGPEAGIVWLDLEHMPEDAPPQVVGHTMQKYPCRKGTVICENVIRKNRPNDGGEAVLVETPARLTALGREEDGSVKEHEFSLPQQSV